MAARWLAVLAVLAVLAAVGTAGAQDSGKTIQQEIAEQLDLFSLCSPGGAWTWWSTTFASMRRVRD